MICLGTIVQSDISGWPYHCPKIKLYIIRKDNHAISLRIDPLQEVSLLRDRGFTFGALFYYLPKGKQTRVLDNMLYITE